MYNGETIKSGDIWNNLTFHTFQSANIGKYMCLPVGNDLYGR